jgi:CheY-like chemotaxis protein/MinD-like ATPase involved in chromosome partitioning or flagellar assembly
MALKILLVDDDLDTLRLVGAMLQRHGFSIVASNNGPQALVLAEKEKPNLILLDIMMPEMDGYEVTRRLKANPQTASIPIIMFSAKGQVDDKVLGFEVGADDYLTKPTQPRELLAHIKAVLARAQKGAGQAATTPPITFERGTVIGVIAARGGLGATTVAINLGITIHQILQRDVTIADFRPGQATLGPELGYLSAEGLRNLLQRETDVITPLEIERELISYAPGIKLLLASHQPMDSKYLLNREHFELISETLANLTHYLVIDLGNNLFPFAGKVLNLIDELIVVIEPVPLTLTQTKTLIKDLTSLGVGEGRTKFVIVNKLRSSVQLTISEVQELLGRAVIATITSAPELAYHASTNQKAMVLQQPESLTASQFQQLVEKVARPHLKIE